MFSSHPGIQSALRLGVYAATIVAITSLTGWSAYRIGTTVVGLLDASIIDGSGRALPEPEWSAPPFASDPRSAETTDTSVSETDRQSGGVSHLTSASTTPVTSAPRASTDDPENDPAAMFHSGNGNTYKTYCVRLCDGFFWPVSFSTTPNRFDADAETCQAACGSPTRLFVHPIPGGGPATMVSQEGLPYTALKSAFLFRTRYDAQCRCQAQPWDEASKDRHKLYAAAAAAERGDAAAIAEAMRLKNKMAEERETQTAARETAERTASVELAKLVETAPLTPPARVERRRRAEQPRREARAVIPISTFDEAPAPKRGFIPASGSIGRAWKDRVFSDD